MPARARRSLAPEDDVRIRRQELAHGVYNFKDVWVYYKKLGWTTKPGPELGYDHYYIKPGKNTKRDVEGEDFFYGEAAIVRYGMKEKIFGEMPEPSQQFQQPAPSSHLPRWRMSTTNRECLSESTCNSEGEFDDDASTSSSTKRATAKAKRRLLQQQQVPRISSSAEKHKQKQERRRPGGGHALDAISITSGSTGSGDDDKSTTTLSLDSSEDDDSDGDFRVDAVDDDDEEEEDSNDDDIVVVNAGILASKLKGNFQAKKRAPRPLLSTKKRKAGADSQGFRHKEKHAAKKAKSYSSSSPSTAVGTRNMKSEPKLSVRTSQYAPASKPSAPTSAYSGKSKRKPKEPRRLSVETKPAMATDTRQTASQSAPQTVRAATTTATSSSAAVAPTKDSSAPSSPRHSFLSPSVPPQATASSGRPREVTPSTQGSQVYVESSGADPPPFESNNVSFEPDPEDFATSFESVVRTKKTNTTSPAVVSSPKLDGKPVARLVVPEAARAAHSTPTQPRARATAVAAPDANPSPAIVHLQLDEVLFPSQQGQTFRVKISSTETPKLTTIWMEHMQTREQRECKFSDIRMLDGEMTPHQIPKKAIFEALMRCLRLLRSSSVTGGESQSEKFSAEEPGKVDLLHLDSDSVCLQLMFPCYEFWQKKHQFMMKLVPAQARLQSLVRELDETKRELATTQHQLSTTEATNQLLETECAQLRTLLRAYQEKEESHQRLQKLQQHQQQMHQELLKDVPEIKPAAVPSVGVPSPHATAASEHISSPKKPIASRKRDTRSFHARSGWLVSSSASTTLQSSPEKSISWDSVLESADRYYQVADEANRVVRVLLTGTYQLNLNVTHENCMGLGVWIRSYNSAIGADKTRKLEPTLVQFYDNKQRVSRLDRVVELSAGDHVSVHLTELSAQRSRSCWLDHFTPQPNIFLLTFLDHELVYKEQAAQE